MQSQFQSAVANDRSRRPTFLLLVTVLLSALSVASLLSRVWNPAGVSDSDKLLQELPARNQWTWIDALTSRLPGPDGNWLILVVDHECSGCEDAVRRFADFARALSDRNSSDIRLCILERHSDDYGTRSATLDELYRSIESVVVLPADNDMPVDRGFLHLRNRTLIQQYSPSEFTLVCQVFGVS